MQITPVTKSEKPSRPTAPAITERCAVVLHPLPQGHDGADGADRDRDGPQRVEPRRQAPAHQRHDGQQQDAAEHQHQRGRDGRPDDLRRGARQPRSAGSV